MHTYSQTHALIFTCLRIAFTLTNAFIHIFGLLKLANSHTYTTLLQHRTIHIRL